MIKISSSAEFNGFKLGTPPNGFERLVLASFNIDYLSLDRAVILSRISNNLNIPIMCLQETNCDPDDITTFNNHLKQYTLIAHTKQRNKAHKGNGVAFLIRNRLVKHMKNVFYSSEVGRGICCIINLKNKLYGIINVYGPVGNNESSKEDTSILLSDINNWLSMLNNNKIPFVIMGDLNAGLHNSHRSNGLNNKDKLWVEWSEEQGLDFIKQVTLDQTATFRTRRGKSFITHALTPKCFVKLFLQESVTIISNRFNLTTSGHYPVIYSLLSSKNNSQNMSALPCLPCCSPSFYENWKMNLDSDSINIEHFINSYQRTAIDYCNNNIEKPVCSAQAIIFSNICSYWSEVIKLIHLNLHLPFNPMLIKYSIWDCNNWDDALTIAHNQRKNYRSEFLDVIIEESKTRKERHLQFLNNTNNTRYLFKHATIKHNTTFIKCTKINNLMTSDPETVLDNSYKYFSNASAKSNCPSLHPKIFETIKKHFTNNLSNTKLLFPVSNNELFSVIKHFKSSSPGINSLYCEVIKKSPLEIIEALKTCINQIFASQQLPKICKKGLISAFFKPNVEETEDNLSDLSNYRPITVMCWSYRLIMYIITKRLEQLVGNNNILSNSQFGFRKFYNTAKACQTVRNCMQIFEADNNKKQMYWVSIDFANAYGSIHHDRLFEILKLMKLPSDFISFLMNAYSEQTAAVKTALGVTKFFNVEQGVLQGCPLSPILWNLYLEPILRYVNDNFNGFKLSNIDRFCAGAYADDLILIFEDKNEAQQAITDICVLGNTMNLKPKAKKCEAVGCLKKIKNNCTAFYTDTIPLLLPNNTKITARTIYEPIRLLGFWFNFKCSWKYNSSIMLSKVKAQANSISIRGIGFEAAKILCNSLLCGHLKYISSLGAAYPEDLEACNAKLSTTFKRITYINQLTSPGFIFGPSSHGFLELSNANFTFEYLFLTNYYRFLNDLNGNSFLAKTSRFLLEKAIEKQLKAADFSKEAILYQSDWVKFVLLHQFYNMDIIGPTTRLCTIPLVPNSSPIHSPSLPDKVEIWTDASVTTFDHGLSSAGGFLITDLQGKCLYQHCFKIHFANDSARAELFTVFVALQVAKYAKQITIYCDATYCKSLINDDWFKLQYQYKEQNLDILSLIHKVKQTKTVIVKWVPSHTDKIEKIKKWGIRYDLNIRADKLSNKGHDSNYHYSSLQQSSRLIPIIEGKAGIYLKYHLQKSILEPWLKRANDHNTPITKSQHDKSCTVKKYSQYLNKLETTTLFKAQVNGFFNNWNSIPICSVCDKQCTIEHLLYDCLEIAPLENHNLESQIILINKKYGLHARFCQLKHYSKLTSIENQISVSREGLFSLNAWQIISKNSHAPKLYISNILSILASSICKTIKIMNNRLNTRNSNKN